MFKSFTSRFFAIYALATLMLFILIFGFISSVMTDHFIENRQNTMLQQSRILSQEYIKAYVTDEKAVLAFIYQVYALSQSVDSRILIFDTHKIVFQDSDTSSNGFAGASFDDMPLLDSTFAGNEIRELGNFGGRFEQAQMITTTPIYHDGEILGAIVMLSPYPALEKDINFIYQLTLLSLLLLLGVTFFATYLFSRKISRSIETLSDSAKKIANGDFTSRVTAVGDGELAQLSSSMNYMATELEKLEDMRKDFIANISHDFRSPLTSIKGFIQAILDGTVPPESQDKYLGIVLDETDRLTKLTNDILLLTKMENNTIQSDMTDFDLHNVIRKTLLQFEQKIIDKKIDFTLLIDRHELFVHADVNQIQRVITNLIDNAVKFCSPADTIVIETSIISRHKVEISVKDSGPGISKTDIKYIWERFHKADRSRGKDKKGIGLGLSIVREIIKAHDEEINVYAQEGKGTTFVFTLTLADV